MYEAYYGFSAKPFQLNPDPQFFFGSSVHRRAMAYLQYGLHQAEGFIVVTGDIGAGKTTLVQQLLHRLPAAGIVPAQIVTTQLEADDLLRVLASSFGLSPDNDNKATLLIRLERYLGQLHADGKRALLIVDEAQNLGARAIEELRMLSNFQIGTKAVLQSFLLGQPELRELMQRPEMDQLRQRILAAYHLGPLDRAEARQYIEHRLRHVGWRNDPSFDDEVFGRIFEAAQGVPRRINTIADRLLLSGFLSERHSLRATDVDDVTNELKLELGPRSGFRDEAASRSPTCAESGPGRFGVAVGNAPSGSGATIEERVALLESSVSSALGTLKTVLRFLRGLDAGAPDHAEAQARRLKAGS